MNLDRPIVSVIVPIYNAEQYIDKCLNSLVSQIYKELEIILVDDGSSDGGAELCDKWAKQDGRIRVYHKPNEGLVSARKKGVTEAKGKYVAHVDVDDWIEPEMYEHMVQWAVENNADVVTSGIFRDYKTHSVVEHEGFERGTYSDERLEKEYWPYVIAIDKFFKTNVNIHITNKLFKREIALKHQMELSDQVRLLEDGAVIYPAIFDAKCVAVTGRAYYHYVIHANSMMSQSKTDTGSRYIQRIFDDVVREKHTIIPNIREQLDRVLLYRRLFTEPERVFETNERFLYPFWGINRGEKVIVYGAGRFGREVFAYLNRTGKCKVVAWCDKVVGNGVIQLEEALKNAFDRVIIAVLLSEVADQIEMMLSDKGIKKEKICRIGMI